LDELLEDAELEECLSALPSSNVNAILKDKNLLVELGEDVFGFKDAVEKALGSVPNKKLSKRSLGLFTILLTDAFPELFGGADADAEGSGAQKSSSRSKRGGAAKKYTDPDEDDIPGGAYLTSDEDDEEGPRKKRSKNATVKSRKGNAGDRPAPLKKYKDANVAYATAHSVPMTPALVKSLKAMMKTLKALPEAEVFTLPVDEDEYPEYYEAVAKPMDITTVTKAAGSYATLGAALDDVSLIWTNAMEYNLEGSEIHDLAAVCQVEASALIRESFAAYIDSAAPAAAKKSKKAKESKEGPADDADDDKDDGAGKPAAPTDVRFPQYFPRGKDASGQPIGKLQLPTRLWNLSLKKIKNHELAGDFLAPLDWYSIPLYMDIVERPMDLETLSGHVSDSKNNGMSTEDLLDDLALIWKNCMTYNAEGSEVYSAAKTMAAFSKKTMEEAMNNYEAAVSACKAATPAKSKKVQKEDLTDDQQKMYKISKKLWLDARSFVFQELDADKIPGYTDVIAAPIDLLTIQHRLETYQSPDAYARDILLVFDNALTFNQEGSEIAALAEALREVATKLLAKQFPGEFQSDAFETVKTTSAPRKYNKKDKRISEPEIKIQDLSDLTASEFSITVIKTLQQIFTPSDGTAQVLKQVKSRLGGNHRLSEENIKEVLAYGPLIAESNPEDQEVYLGEALSIPLIREIAISESKGALADVGGKEGVSCSFGAAMYDVIDWGDIKFTSLFSSKSLVYPVGFKVARHMQLAAVPNEHIPKVVSGKAAPIGIQDPVSGVKYESLPIELFSQIVSTDSENGKTPMFEVCIANGTILAKAADPLVAWQEALKRADEIPALLGAKFIRCRAVFNRIACAESSAPYLEKPALAPAEMKDYRKIVEAPMWLREVHSRLINGAYDLEFDFAWDMRLIFTNAMQYNAAGSSLYDGATALLALFDSLLCDWVYNPQDVSLDDHAAGPWKQWGRLKYFDYPEEVGVCRASGEATTKNNSVQCRMCKDVFADSHADPPCVGEGADKQNWYCQRCASAQSKVEKETGKKEFVHTVESFGGVRYAPAVSLGHGWYQALEKGQTNKRLPKYFSPLGYHCENKEIVAEIKSMEKGIHDNLIRARKAEFDEMENNGGSPRKSPVRSSARGRTSSPNAGGDGDMDVDDVTPEAEEDSQSVSAGKFATYQKPAGYTFLWFGNKDDDYNLDGVNSESAGVDKQLFHVGDKVMAARRESHKKFKGTIHAINEDGSMHLIFDDKQEDSSICVTSVRLLSNAGKAFPTKLYYGLDEVTKPAGCCASWADYTSIHPNCLPKTGFFGIHLLEIQRCIEGLPNAVRLPISYNFRNARKIFDGILSEYRKYDEGVTATVHAESLLALKVHTELQHWKEQRLLGAEADKAEKEEMEEDEDSGDEDNNPTIRDRGVNSLKPLFDVQTATSKTDTLTLTTEVGERLMVVWDFLDMARPIIDDSVLALDDVFRSVLPNLAHNIMPTIAQGIYDDICLMYCNFLMREVRTRCGFDGVRCSKGLIHTRNTLGMGNSDVLSEAHWQNIISYKPVNSHTWPVVARNLLLVTSNELSIEESQHMFLHPLQGNAAVQQELICLLMAHPFALQFTDQLHNRGEFVSANEGSHKLYHKQSVPVVGATGPSECLNQVRSRCMWNAEYYQGSYYASIADFARDVMHVLLTRKADENIDADVSHFHTLALIDFFRGLLNTYGLQTDTWKKGRELIPAGLDSVYKRLSSTPPTGCYGSSSSSCGKGWCCNCASTSHAALSREFHIAQFGGSVPEANIAPSLYAVGFDHRVLTVNKLHGTSKDAEAAMPSHGSADWCAGWYAKRMEALCELRRSLCLLHAKEVDLWDMSDKIAVLNTFTNACMESRVLAAVLDSKALVSSDVDIKKDPGGKFDPAYWIDREKRGQAEYIRLKGICSFIPAPTGGSANKTASAHGRASEDDGNDQPETINDIKSDVFENLTEAFAFIGTLERYVPSRAIAETCHFSGLSSKHASSSMWPSNWVVVPQWLATSPAKNNFTKVAKNLADDAKIGMDSDCQANKPHKIVALEHVVLLVAAARLASLKEERSIEDRVSGLVEHLTKTDAFYAKEIESKSIKMADIMATRGKSLGKDSAGWQYWLLCVQHRYSKKPLGKQVMDRHERANLLDHEPCLLIKSTEGSWSFLDCGSRPDGFMRLLNIFQNSNSSRELKLRLTLVERLAHCMMTVWRDGIFRIRNLSFLFLDKRFKGELDLLDLLADAEASNEFGTESLLPSAVDTFNNRTEMSQARVAEARALGVLSWIHRMESDVDNSKGQQTQTYVRLREREFRRLHSYDALDYHPSKGYWRTDLISRITQLQPVLSASTVHADPTLAEFIRYGQRCRDDLVTRELAEHGLLPFVSQIPPAKVLGNPALNRDLLQDVFEDPTRALKSLQAGLVADSKSSMLPSKAASKADSIGLESRIDLLELAEARQPQRSYFAEKKLTYVYAQQATDDNNDNADAMEVDTRASISVNDVEEEEEEDDADVSEIAEFKSAVENYSARHSSTSAPPPATAETFDINQQSYCGFGTLTTEFGIGNVRYANDCGYSSAGHRTYRKLIEQRHMTTKGVLRIYESQKHAADFLHVSQSGISLCCNKKQTDAYGFCWQFYKGPPLDFDVINAANFQLNKTEVLKLHSKKAINNPLNNVGRVAQVHHAAPAPAPAPAAASTVDQLAKNCVSLSNLPRDVNPTFPPMPDVYYRVMNAMESETMYTVPMMRETMLTQNIKPPLSLSKQRQSGRILYLKGELINLVYLLANEHLHMFSDVSWLHTIATEAAAAQADPSKLIRGISHKSETQTSFDVTATKDGALKRSRKEREEASAPPSKAIKKEPGESASAFSTITSTEIVMDDDNEVDSSVSSSASDSESSDSEGEDPKSQKVKTEKTRLKPEQQAEQDNVSKTKNLVDTLVKMIQSATNPAEMMRCVYFVEETIPFRLRRAYDAWALPFDAVTCAQVATRLFGIDRFVRYDLCKSLEATAVTLQVSAFSPRSCAHPRCMSTVMCGLPLFHSGYCGHAIVHCITPVAAGQLPKPAKQLATRHQEIYDATGYFFTPAQGMEVDDARLAALRAAFDDQRRKQLAAQEAEARERLALEQRSTMARNRQHNASLKSGNNTMREFEEDEFSDEERLKKDREVKIKIDIEYVIPYRPTIEEMVEYYDI